MNKFMNILNYIIILFAVVIIVSVLFSGCDKIRCCPQYNTKGNYIGFKCGGEF